jgi:hypothetical protein
MGADYLRHSSGVDCMPWTGMGWQESVALREDHPRHVAATARLDEAGIGHGRCGLPLRCRCYRVRVWIVSLCSVDDPADTDHRVRRCARRRSTKLSSRLHSLARHQQRSLPHASREKRNSNAGPGFQGPSGRTWERRRFAGTCARLHRPAYARGNCSPM